MSEYEFQTDDIVKLNTSVFWGKDESVTSEGTKGRVSYAKSNYVMVHFDGETTLRCVDPLDIDMVTPAPRPPTVSDLISELAAFLGHDIDTSTEAGILADALAELARLRAENENRAQEINRLYRAMALHDVQVMIHEGKDIT